MPGHDDLGGLSTRSAPPPDGIVRYAQHPEGTIDVHLPLPRLSIPAPLLLLVHGGFWKQTYDRTHTRAAAAALAAEGFVVATPEYRRVGGSGGWPTTAEDVALATRAAPDLLAGIGVPTHGLTLAGHSAGGHLALWVANEPPGRRVDRVVGLAPVADLRAAARERLGDSATQALLGGEPDEVPGSYAAADPATRLAERPSCEIRVVHGTEDEEVPLAHNRAVAARYSFLDLRAVEGADHFALINPASAAWPVVLDALRPTG